MRFPREVGGVLVGSTDRQIPRSLRHAPLLTSQNIGKLDCTRPVSEVR